MQQQKDEHAALPTLTEPDRIRPVRNLKRSQQAKQHASTS
jgi:hypothetical protein